MSGMPMHQLEIVTQDKLSAITPMKHCVKTCRLSRNKLINSNLIDQTEPRQYKIEDNKRNIFSQ